MKNTINTSERNSTPNSCLADHDDQQLAINENPPTPTEVVDVIESSPVPDRDNDLVIPSAGKRPHHTVNYGVLLVNRAAEKFAKDTVQFASALKKIKDNLPHGDWTPLFDTGRVNISLRVAQNFLKIAANSALAKTKNSSYLPTSMDALLALSNLESAVVEQGIKEKTINASMTIAEAKKFAASKTIKVEVCPDDTNGSDFHCASIASYLKKKLAPAPDSLLIENVVPGLIAVLEEIKQNRIQQQQAKPTLERS